MAMGPLFISAPFFAGLDISTKLQIPALLEFFCGGSNNKAYMYDLQ